MRTTVGPTSPAIREVRTTAADVITVTPSSRDREPAGPTLTDIGELDLDRAGTWSILHKVYTRFSNRCVNNDRTNRLVSSHNI